MKHVSPEIKKTIHASEPINNQPSFLSQFTQWTIAPFMLSTLGFLFYYPSMSYNFQFDDIANITKFYYIREHTFWSCFFHSPRWISLWLNAANYRMGANDPFAPYYYRLFNISFHIITTILLFYAIYLALRLLKHDSFFKKYQFLLALVTSLLFLLHPVQTQTVSYIIQGRLEGLVGLFVIAMVLCFLLFCIATRLWAKIICSSLLFVITFLSCGTKEAAIVSPVLLLLVDWFFVSQGSWQSLKSRAWLHATIWVTVFGCYLHFFRPNFFVEIFTLKHAAHNNIGNMLTENRTDQIAPLHFFISEFKVILHYLWIFIWPFGISVDYDWKMVKDFFSPDCIFPFLFLVAVGGFIAWLLRRNKTNLVAFGLLWFFVSIAPRATIIASSELMADYKTYLASVGWLFVLAAGILYGFILLTKFVSALKPIHHHVHHHVGAQMALATLLAMPLGYASYERNKVWRSAQEFWLNVLQNAPNRARAYNNYGVALSEANKHQEAVPYFKKAAKMDHLYPDPLNNLSVAYSVLGDVDAAIDVLKKSLNINPYYPEAYNNLASFYIHKRNFQDADKLIQVALQIRPYYGKAYYNKGRMFIEMAKDAKDPAQQKTYFEQAQQAFKDACTKADFDNNLVGLNEWAKMSMQLQQYDDAIVALKKMYNLNPGLHEALFMLGNAYYLKKDLETSRSMYLQAAQLNPQDARVWNNLGEVHFVLKEYELALEYFTKTTQLNNQLLNPQLRVAECLDRLGKPKEAKKLLDEIIKMPDIPAQIRSNITVVLAQLDQRIRKMVK